MKDHATHLELVEIAELDAKTRDRRRSAETSRIVENGIVLATFDGDDAGIKYLRERMIPMGITHRVLALKQRRAGDWK